MNVEFEICRSGSAAAAAMVVNEAFKVENRQQLERGGGRTHLLLAFGHLTIDYSSLSRWSTVPTPNRHLQHSVRSLRFFHMFHKKLFAYPLPVSPSVATINLLG